jgi:hypothetical protein
MAMMAFETGYRKGLLVEARYRVLIRELTSLPGKLEQALKVND